MLDIIITICVLFLIIILWIILYDSNRFIGVYHEIISPKIKQPSRAIVIADLHNKEFGSRNERLIHFIQEQQPDMILIAGDILTAKPGKTIDKAITFLEQLIQLCPLYYVNGNHEQRIALYPEKYGNMAEEYEKKLKELDINRIINNQIILSESGMTIYGLEIEKKYYQRFHITPMPPDYLKGLLKTPDQSHYNILIAHNPDYFPWYAKWGADLVLSGHVHGGMVRIPGWKGLVSPLVRLFPKYDGGVFKEGSSTMLLSRGLGMHTIPIRLFNPAEVLILDFLPEAASKKH